MRRKTPEVMSACFELIEREMLKGPWVMGASYTVADAYLYTITSWLEGDGVDRGRFPKVQAHWQRMEERAAVRKVVAEELAV